MFCRNCGKELSANAVACMACGCDPQKGSAFCPNCGSAVNAGQVVCTKCGVSLVAAPSATAGSKSKIVAGLLAIFLGGLGIHKFYLDISSGGAIMLITSLLGGMLLCGIPSLVMGIIGLVEGILYLTKSDAEFEEIYVKGKKSWF